MRYFFLLVVAITIGFSTWASSPMFGYPLGGMNQGQISNLYPNLVTPATYAFSIWGLIYLSWIVMAILIAIGYISAKTKFLQVFSAAVFLSSLWLVPFQYQYQLTSLGVMLWILVLALWSVDLAQSEHRTVRLMSQLFLGWITVATAANIAIVVVSTPLLANIGIFSPVIWTIIGLAVATMVHVWVAICYRAYVPGLVLIWALIANMMVHSDMVQRVGVGMMIGVMIGVGVYNFVRG
ncbi:MAG: tryptophan-rich sensory protein [Candidatus Gracilibacteria bacterium]|nr:tryptophan-rich sensory protein [Candidatus Gracilibacteria bacterium]